MYYFHALLPLAGGVQQHAASLRPAAAGQAVQMLLDAPVLATHPIC
jgi:hypothetical protein